MRVMRGGGQRARQRRAELGLGLVAQAAARPAPRLGVIPDCRFAAQLNHFIPGFLSYSVDVFLIQVAVGYRPPRASRPEASLS
jgi:hypothetical protein